MTRPVSITSASASRRTFQNGRVSSRSSARLTALMIEAVAPLAAHRAPTTPMKRAITEPAWLSAELCLARSIASSTPFGATEPSRWISES